MTKAKTPSPAKTAKKAAKAKTAKPRQPGVAKRLEALAARVETLERRQGYLAALVTALPPMAAAAEDARKALLAEIEANPDTP